MTLPPPTLTITRPRRRLCRSGRNASLSWQSSNAAAARRAMRGPVRKPLSSVSSSPTAPAATTLTFELTCTGSGGSISRSAVLTVAPAADGEPHPSRRRQSRARVERDAHGLRPASGPACAAARRMERRAACHRHNDGTPSAAGSQELSRSRCTGAGGSGERLRDAHRQRSASAPPPQSSGGGGSATAPYELFALLPLLLSRPITRTLARTNAATVRNMQWQTCLSCASSSRRPAT